jgi:HPt (histidine-containing phosphotransfer) domain-containing protein
MQYWAGEPRPYKLNGDIMPVIDKATFNELKQMSGEDFINELIDAFIDDAPNMIRAMQTALDSKDVESFRRNAHSMKSNANTFGATELAALAKELEVMGKENNLDVGNRLEVLKEAYGKVAEELKGMRA